MKKARVSITQNPDIQIGKRVRSKPATVSSLRAGNFCSIRYSSFIPSKYQSSNKRMLVMVVANTRTATNGVLFYHKSKDGTRGKYLSCFKVDHLMIETLAAIQSSLNTDKYKKFAKVKSYKYLKTIFNMFIGPQNYRTLSLTNGYVDSVIKYDVSTLDEDEE